MNIGKRLVKSPKVYVLDSGLLHHLLGVMTVYDLIGHPGAGASWEGFVIEQICNRLPRGAVVSFYRTAATAAPKVTKEPWQACSDLAVDRAYVVAPVREPWPLANDVGVISPLQLP